MGGGGEGEGGIGADDVCVRVWGGEGVIFEFSLPNHASK